MFNEFRKKFINGFLIQRNVISALLFRQVNIKLSQTSLGIFGVFLEPLILILIFLGLFSLVRERLIPGINPVIFLSIGIILFRIFATTSLQAYNKFKTSKPLFFYRPVKPIDAAITNSVLNSCLFSILLIAIMFVCAIYNEKFYFNDFPLMVISITLLVIFSFSVGVILMIASHRFPPVIKATTFIRRPLFFTSGCLFSSAAVPQAALKFLLWNPLLHAIELARVGTSNEYNIADEISLNYLIEVTFVTLLLSMVIYANNKEILIK